MCGRYYIEIDEKELQDIISVVEKKTGTDNEQISLMKTSGEIFPADIVPVMTGMHQYQPMKWGFANYSGRPVINARSETATVKSMFRDSMKERRCLIPASGYFEWKKEENQKTKYQIFVPGELIYFAGCYRQEQHNPFFSFCILTKQATGGVESIHDRMPAIIPQGDIEAWLYGPMEETAYSELDLTFRAADKPQQQLSLFGSTKNP